MRLRITECLAERNRRPVPGQAPMTKADLARALGVNPSQITRWDQEDPDDREPKASMVQQIAEILGVPISHLFFSPERCQAGNTEARTSGA